MTAHVDAGDAEAVLQTAAHAFDSAALFEALGLVWSEVKFAAATLVVIDQRHMAQALAVGADDRPQ